MHLDGMFIAQTFMSPLTKTNAAALCSSNNLDIEIAKESILVNGLSQGTQIVSSTASPAGSLIIAVLQMTGGNNQHKIRSVEGAQTAIAGYLCDECTDNIQSDGSR